MLRNVKAKKGNCKKVIPNQKSTELRKVKRMYMKFQENKTEIPRHQFSKIGLGSPFMPVFFGRYLYAKVAQVYVNKHFITSNIPNILISYLFQPVFIAMFISSTFIPLSLYIMLKDGIKESSGGGVEENKKNK